MSTSDIRERLLRLLDSLDRRKFSIREAMTKVFMGTDNKSSYRLIINENSPVEFGERPDGTMWLSVETPHGHLQEDWVFGVENAKLLREAVESQYPLWEQRNG